MTDYPSNPVRDTDKLSSEHKQQLDKTCVGMTSDQLSHGANHLHNLKDKLDAHSSKTITMADYKKAMKGSQDES